MSYQMQKDPAMQHAVYNNNKYFIILLHVGHILHYMHFLETPATSMHAFNTAVFLVKLHVGAHINP